MGSEHGSKKRPYWWRIQQWKGGVVSLSRCLSLWYLQTSPLTIFNPSWSAKHSKQNWWFQSQQLGTSLHCLKHFEHTSKHSEVVAVEASFQKEHVLSHRNPLVPAPFQREVGADAHVPFRGAETWCVVQATTHGILDRIVIYCNEWCRSVCCCRSHP